MSIRGCIKLNSKSDTKSLYRNLISVKASLILGWERLSSRDLRFRRQTIRGWKAAPTHYTDT